MFFTSCSLSSPVLQTVRRARSCFLRATRIRQTTEAPRRRIRAIRNSPTRTTARNKSGQVRRGGTWIEDHQGNLECTVAQVDSEEDQTPSSAWDSRETVCQVVPCNATCIEWLLYFIIVCLCTCILPTCMFRHQVPEKSKESTGFP